MNRRHLLSLLATTPLLTKKAWAQPTNLKNLLVIFCRGGGDTTMVFDPHFSALEIDSPLDSDWAEQSGIYYASSPFLRPNVDTFFANHAHRCTVINGIAVGSISHPKCEQLLFTGAIDSSATDLPTVIASNYDVILPHVVLSGPRFPGSYGSSVTPIDSLFSQLLTPLSENEQKLQEYLIHSASSDIRLHAEYVQNLQRRAQLSEYTGLISVSDNPSVMDEVRKRSKDADSNVFEGFTIRSLATM